MPAHTPAHTIESLIEWVSDRFGRAPLSFGHGTDNAWDEAVVLVTHVTGVPDNTAYLNRPVSAAHQQRVEKLCEQRITEKIPLAYLLGSCAYMGLQFQITPDVLVPRSPIGYLLAEQLDAWLPTEVNQVLDLCSGSGCLGIVAAHLFEQASVTLVDIDSAALDVADRNIQQHQLQHRVRALQADVTQPWPLHPHLQDTRFDLIICNPPYVDSSDMASLPSEYQAEPRLALAAGSDGLQIISKVLALLPSCLGAGGLFVGEVGASAPALLRNHPRLPFVWPQLSAGGEGVFILDADALNSHTGADN